MLTPILKGIATLLPDVNNSYVSNIHDALIGLVPYWNSWNNIFPLDILVLIIGIILIMEGVILGARISVFVWKQLRGSG
jgi:hypothetical protein